jgi:hypothetical protein
MAVITLPQCRVNHLRGFRLPEASNADTVAVKVVFVDVEAP